MNRILLGDNLEVSPLGFGGMALTPVYGAVDPAEALQTLHHAVDAGVTFIDTANIYGGGSNEELIAQLLKTRRNEVQLATKFALVGSPATGYSDIRGDAAHVREAIDESLRRLGTDSVDLYYMHRRDVRVPLEETVGAMAELVAAGKVRHLGLSEVTAEELRTAHAVHPIAAVQSEWSIWSRDVEAHVVPAAAELGVGLVPYSPLGRGFLTGTIHAQDLGPGDFRHNIPRFAEGALEANQQMADAVRQVAGELTRALGRETTPAQVALAWLYGQGRAFGLAVVPIPGTRRAERIDENLGALALELSPAQREVLGKAADAVVGFRAQDPSWVSQGRE
ncbi:aryl-alcohol dehydrogenase-like predicted oxidoreductase [Arthrobacter silviterrae]|uniref:Aldo/keto reductase n=1 Tax=Arthrobacter silviterrae TaxID=2026658 RepID=A0ABX0D9H5_9MICC|nr:MULTISPECIES: aldo/keto reductase [Arthrobacter]MCU6479580.1 aldo/keto reductase [Arthrobacter sp. A2-55]MDQ0277993.1 aryl-alcohol dehydrogenase-like predicted oxidoreductase [Arthrobacter silviterrae]NGN83547.1 aldo/keto reductase [Arthrobacter silviterrae]